MAPINQDIFQLPTSRISPIARLSLALPIFLFIYAIIRRFKRRKMSSSQDSSANKYSRAIHISDHTGEKLQLHLSIEEANPPNTQTSTADGNNASRLEASSSNDLHQPFDMTKLPLPTATEEMKHHTTTLTEREFPQPPSPSANPAAPRLQKESVQIFKETGSESRKNWRRKVLEYR
ncbi:hypothetical protein MaudCBS49596_000140 [Microsporum audouinii]